MFCTFKNVFITIENVVVSHKHMSTSSDHHSLNIDESNTEYSDDHQTSNTCTSVSHVVSNLLALRSFSTVVIFVFHDSEVFMSFCHFAHFASLGRTLEM